MLFLRFFCARRLAPSLMGASPPSGSVLGSLYLPRAIGFSAEELLELLNLQLFHGQLYLELAEAERQPVDELLNIYLSHCQPTPGRPGSESPPQPSGRCCVDS